MNMKIKHCTIILVGHLAVEVQVIYACPSVCTQVRASVISFSRNLFLRGFLHNFTQWWKSRKEISDWSKFSRKLLVCPIMRLWGPKMDPRQGFLEFLENFCLFFFFCWKYPKLKHLAIVCFPIKTQYLGKCCFTS